MTQAYDAIIATITTTNDAVSITKSMIKGTLWREGTSGNWQSGNCKLSPGTIYQFKTTVNGMASSSVSTAVLPNIKAFVEVDWDTTGTPIFVVGNNFMDNYALYCSELIYLGVPDTSGLISVGDKFMNAYAMNCTKLIYLGVPNTSGVTSAGADFLNAYANGCSNLKSLEAPDTSKLAIVGNYFLGAFAGGCSNLIYFGVPDTTMLKSAGTSFMTGYAQNCNALLFLYLPSDIGWFKDNNVNWDVPSGLNNILRGITPDVNAQVAWQTLVVSGKTLYTNYIRTTTNVTVIPENVSGSLFDHLLFDKSKFDKEFNDYLESYIFSESSMVVFPEVETPIRPTRISTGPNDIDCDLSYLIELMAVHPVDDLGFGGIKDAKLILYLPLTIGLYSEGTIDDPIIGDMKLSTIDLRSIELKPNETITIDTDSMTVLFGLVHDVSSITDASIFFELDKGVNDLIITWEYESVPSPMPEKQLDVTVIWQNRYL